MELLFLWNTPYIIINKWMYMVLECAVCADRVRFRSLHMDMLHNLYIISVYLRILQGVFFYVRCGISQQFVFFLFVLQSVRTKCCAYIETVVIVIGAV